MNIVHADIENQLHQPILAINNPTELTAEKKAYDEEVLALSCPVSLYIFLDPVRLIFANSQKSPHTFEKEIVQNLQQPSCPMTREAVIGYINDVEMRQKVATFLKNNDSAHSLQYPNNTWAITETANRVMTRQNNNLFSRRVTFKTILKLALSGIILGGVYFGGFLAAASALGSTILQDHHQEIGRQADTAYAGGAMLGTAVYYLVIAYKFSYAKHSWTNNEIIAALTKYILAALASIPLGTLIVPFEEHNTISLMILKQFSGLAILAILVSGIIYLNRQDEVDEPDTNIIAPRANSLIPFLENYIESTPVAAMGATRSLTNPLLLANALAPDRQQAILPSNDGVVPLSLAQRG